MTEVILTHPEFSRPVRLDDIGPRGLDLEIAASAHERELLAKRFSLQRIDKLDAAVQLRRIDGGGKVRLTGHLDASVVQTCVVSLEPVDETVAEDIDIVFERVPEGASAREVVLAAAEEAEPLEGDTLDVGEVVAEELALALNPYPRRADSELEPGPSQTDEEVPPGPFEKLARLRRGD